MLALEFAESAVGAAIESAAAEQGDEGTRISEVRVKFGEDSVAIAVRLKMEGRAWPPRLPIDTELTVKLGEILAGSEGDSGCLMCRVVEPLSFSSAFAELLAGLLGRLLKGIPAPLETLRRKDAVLTLDFAAMVRAGRPDLAQEASRVRLHRIKVTAGRVRLEIGFSEGLPER